MNRPGDIAPSRYPGERLGLPEAGPRSVGRIGRRIGAIVVDWAIASFLSFAFFHYDQWATLGLFALLQVVFIPTIGGSLGHRIFGMRVVAIRGGWVGVWRPVVRTAVRRPRPGGLPEVVPYGRRVRRCGSDRPPW